MKTNYGLCDPETFKKIVNKWHDNMANPDYSFPKVRPFKIIDEEKGTEESYSLNTENDFMRSRIQQTEVIHEYLPDASFEEIFAYSWRIDQLFRFVHENEDQLKKMDLVRKNETHKLYANVLFWAAATCKIGKRGFKFQDMDREIKKYDPRQNPRRTH